MASRTKQNKCHKKYIDDSGMGTRLASNNGARKTISDGWSDPIDRHVMTGQTNKQAIDSRSAPLAGGGCHHRVTK